MSPLIKLYGTDFVKYLLFCKNTIIIGVWKWGESQWSLKTWLLVCNYCSCINIFMLWLCQSNTYFFLHGVGFFFFWVNCAYLQLGLGVFFWFEVFLRAKIKFTFPCIWNSQWAQTPCVSSDKMLQKEWWKVPCWFSKEVFPVWCHKGAFWLFFWCFQLLGGWP